MLEFSVKSWAGMYTLTAVIYRDLRFKRINWKTYCVRLIVNTCAGWCAVHREKDVRTRKSIRQLDHNLSGKKTREMIGQEKGDSGPQVQRFIRLTNLITPILDMVDEKRMAMGPAVELSYLNRDEQEMLLDLMQIGDCTPSLSQAIRLRKLSENDQFDSDHLDEIMDAGKE